LQVGLQNKELTQLQERTQALREGELAAAQRVRACMLVQVQICVICMCGTGAQVKARGVAHAALRVLCMLKLKSFAQVSHAHAAVTFAFVSRITC